MADTPAESQGTPIPIPSDFPVTWDHPDDEKLSWGYELMHCPEPVTPLDGEFLSQWWGSKGVGGMQAELDMPFRNRGRLINNYIYLTGAQVVPDEAVEAHSKAAEDRVKATMFQVRERWTGDWLPEIQTHLAFWEAFDLPDAPMDDLIAHLDETLKRGNRLWHLHFLIVDPSYLAVSLFEELYLDLFEDSTSFDAYKLLQGFDNKTVETSHALWDLSQQAPAEVREILQTHEAVAVLAALAATPAGQAFMIDFNAYLDIYGQQNSMWGVSFPSRIEDPTPVIRILQGFIKQPERNPRVELAQLKADGEQAIAQARDRLQGFPQPVIDQFETLLKVAQAGIVLTEDHGFYIDFRSTYKIRCVFMEFGRRFAAANVIDEPGDIFYLETAEIRETAARLPDDDRHSLIAARRAQHEHFRTITPPSTLGTEYDKPSPDTAMSRQGAKFFGTPPPASDDPTVLHGHSGSPGKIQGRARILQSVAEADKLHQGDILVAKTTAPPWTPLFATAGAIVTDTGGILSHCAVVAREYGIPAVVGVGQATQVIQDGQLLEVDGEAGIVRLL